MTGYQLIEKLNALPANVLESDVFAGDTDETSIEDVYVGEDEAIVLLTWEARQEHDEEVMDDYWEQKRDERKYDDYVQEKLRRKLA